MILIHLASRRNNRPDHPSIWRVSGCSADRLLIHLCTKYIVHYSPCSGRREMSVETSVSTLPLSMNLGKRLLIVQSKSSIGEFKSNFPLITNNNLRCGHRIERSYKTSSACAQAPTVSGSSKSVRAIFWEKLNVTLSK